MNIRRVISSYIARTKRTEGRETEGDDPCERRKKPITKRDVGETKEKKKKIRKKWKGSANFSERFEENTKARRQKKGNNGEMTREDLWKTKNVKWEMTKTKYGDNENYKKDKWLKMREGNKTDCINELGNGNIPKQNAT